MNEIHNVYKYFEEASRGRSDCYLCNPFKESVVYESENFIVVLDTFPIITGHLMISSKKHYGCAGELPHEHVLELLSLKKALRNQIEKSEGKAIFYEHGRAGCCLENNFSANECSHFHLHCLPASISLELALKKTFDHYKLSNYSEIIERFCEKGHYLYFENSKGEMNFFTTTDQEVESHLLRTMICNSLGIAERSNWENCKDAEPYVMNYNWVKEKVIFNDF